MAALRSYPCVIVGLSQEGSAAYVKQNVREGDEIALRHRAGHDGEADVVDCLHDQKCIGQIPQARRWVGRSLAVGDRQKVRVTGFDTNDFGDPTSVEIEIMLL